MWNYSFIINCQDYYTNNYSFLLRDFTCFPNKFFVVLFMEHKVRFLKIENTFLCFYLHNCLKIEKIIKIHVYKNCFASYFIF